MRPGRLLEERSSRGGRWLDQAHGWSLLQSLSDLWPFVVLGRPGSLVSHIQQYSGEVSLEELTPTHSCSDRGHSLVS